MGWDCRVEADSAAPWGTRLVTLVVTYPRCCHAELLTHRAFSRNSASSRAIPVARLIEAVEADPFVPEEWGSNRAGMQAGGPLPDGEAAACRRSWLEARDAAVRAARELSAAGLHKQHANRLLEPFAWITTVITATDWANFFALRCHPDAMPEMRRAAEMMRDAVAASTPAPVGLGEWHLPFVRQEDRDALSVAALKDVSAGRCARVSYLTHDGRRDPEADAALARRLATHAPVHASPFEHQATPCARPPRGNLRYWQQYRHELPGEHTPG